METKAFKFNVKNLDTAGDSDNFVFEGHLAVFGNVDSGNDKILPGATVKSLETSVKNGNKNLPIFWAHQLKEPVGVFPIDQMKEDEKGLFVTGFMPKNDTFVSGRVIPQMRVGSVGKMSIGYIPTDHYMEKGVRILKEIVLLEGSLVPLAMNDEARITSMKSLSLDDLSDIDQEKLVSILTDGIRFKHDDAEKLVKKVFDNIDKKSKMTAFENRLDYILNNIKGRA